MIKIKSIIRKITTSAIFTAFTFGICGNISAQPNVTFNASIDSLVILMGKQTVLHYQIIQDKGVDGIIEINNPRELAPHVEIALIKDNDTTDLKNDREEIHKSLIIQAFDSGIWEIPAAKYIIGKDTVFSNELALKVIPVDVDSLATIHGFKDKEGVPFNPFDFIPDFIYYYWKYILLVILLIIAGCCYYFTRRKPDETEVLSEIPLLPPYEEAIEALGALKAAKLWQAGQDKEYYTRLTDILRRYIDRRFGINAVEMTTTQIIDTLKRNEETRAVNQQMKQILEIADFVKFANMRPLPDDNEASWNRAEKFVNDTKPEPEVVADEATTGKVSPESDAQSNVSQEKQTGDL